jgi:hypothetical protein
MFVDANSSLRRPLFLEDLKLLCVEERIKTDRVLLPMNDLLQPELLALVEAQILC